MHHIFIDGEAGTTGLQIKERLLGEPSLNVLSIPPELRKDLAAKKRLYEQADVVILCLHDEAAREAVALADGLGANSPRLIDASSAHRTAAGWVYGFAELASGQADAIRAARRVSNPGCYATGAIALIRPLIDAGLLAPETHLALPAISGYSGGGRSMIEAHDSGQAPAFELYALGLQHKHLPEIMAHTGLRQRPLFVPSVGHFPQGMLVQLPLHLDTLPGQPKAQDLHDALLRHYASAHWVQVLPPTADGKLDAVALHGQDLIELRVYGNESARQALLVARLDNLGKGASGAAVQNLRLMLGW